MGSREKRRDCRDHRCSRTHDSCAKHKPLDILEPISPIGAKQKLGFLSLTKKSNRFTICGVPELWSSQLRNAHGVHLEVHVRRD